MVVQGIVDLVLPELAREDALEEYNFLTKHGLPVPSLVLDRAGLANEATASTKQIANGNNNGGGGGGDAAQSSSAAARPVYQDNVTFYLMPATMGVSEPLPPLDKNVLRTTAAVTVQALQKFVIKKLKLTVASKDVSACVRVHVCLLTGARRRFCCCTAKRCWDASKRCGGCCEQWRLRTRFRPSSTRSTRARSSSERARAWPRMRICCLRPNT